MRRFLLLNTTLGILFLFAAIPSFAQNAGSEKLVFAPQWIPQAQFAGYYVAQDKGFYKEAGLDVDILHPSASRQATALLENGEADVVSLFLVTGLAFMDQGLDMVHIGQISQHSSILLVTKKSSGIDRIDQLDGKKIGIWKSGFDELPKALMTDKQLHPEWIPLLSSVNLFMMDGIEAMTVMWYNEYNQIIQSGINEDELNTFFLSRMGYDIPEDGLYCLRSTALRKKDALRKFMEATLKGWDYAQKHRDEALESVILRVKEAHIPSNKAHQQWMLDKVLEMIHPGDKQILPGHLLEQDYLDAEEVLFRSGKIQKKTNYHTFHFPLEPR